MKLGRFGVAKAPFGLRFGPSESKWSHDLKTPGFGIPGVMWGSKLGIFRFWGQFGPPWDHFGTPITSQGLKKYRFCAILEDILEVFGTTALT